MSEERAEYGTVNTGNTNKTDGTDNTDGAGGAGAQSNDLIATRNTLAWIRGFAAEAETDTWAGEAGLRSRLRAIAQRCATALGAMPEAAP